MLFFFAIYKTQFNIIKCFQLNLNYFIYHFLLFQSHSHRCLAYGYLSNQISFNPNHLPSLSEPPSHGKYCVLFTILELRHPKMNQDTLLWCPQIERSSRTSSLFPPVSQNMIFMTLFSFTYNHLPCTQSLMCQKFSQASSCEIEKPFSNHPHQMLLSFWLGISSMKYQLLAKNVTFRWLD